MTERTVAMERMEVSCAPLSPTSPALSAQLVFQEIKELQARRAHVDRRERQERMERTATRARTDYRDQLACKAHRGLLDLQGRKEHRDESSKSMDQLDPKDHQDLLALKARRDHQAQTEPTQVDLPAHRETMDRQDHLVRQALRGHQAHQDKVESREAANTARLLVLHLDINLLAILLRLHSLSHKREWSEVKQRINN